MKLWQFYILAVAVSTFAIVFMGEIKFMIKLIAGMLGLVFVPKYKRPSGKIKVIKMESPKESDFPVEAWELSKQNAK
jgi:hypothetical protein